MIKAVHLAGNFGYLLAQVLGLQHFDVGSEGEQLGHQLAVHPHGEGDGVGVVVVVDDTLILAERFGLDIGVTLVRNPQDYLLDGHVAVAAHTNHVVEECAEIYLRLTVGVPPLADAKYAVKGEVLDAFAPFDCGKKKPTAVELLEMVRMNFQILGTGLEIRLVSYYDGMAVCDALQQSGEMRITGKGTVVLETDVGVVRL